MARAIVKNSIIRFTPVVRRITIPLPDVEIKYLFKTYGFILFFAKIVSVAGFPFIDAENLKLVQEAYLSLLAPVMTISQYSAEWRNSYFQLNEMRSRISSLEADISKSDSLISQLNDELVNIKREKDAAISRADNADMYRNMVMAQKSDGGFWKHLILHAANIAINVGANYFTGQSADFRDIKSSLGTTTAILSRISLLIPNRVESTSGGLSRENLANAITRIDDGMGDLDS